MIGELKMAILQAITDVFGAVTIHQQGLIYYPTKLQILSVNSKKEKQ